METAAANSASSKAWFNELFTAAKAEELLPPIKCGSKPAVFNAALKELASSTVSIPFLSFVNSFIFLAHFVWSKPIPRYFWSTAFNVSSICLAGIIAWPFNIVFASPYILSAWFWKVL